MTQTAAVNSAPAVEPGQGQRAADRAVHRNSVTVALPFVGTVDLPPSDELAYMGGLGVLAVAGVLEWPVAAVLVAGHLLGSNRRNKTLAAFGEALEEA